MLFPWIFFVSFHTVQYLVNNGVSVNAFSSDSPSQVQEEPGDSRDWSLSSLGEPRLKCFFNNYYPYLRIEGPFELAPFWSGYNG